MRVLMFSAYFLTPVLERELEIIANHLESGDEVIAVRCSGQLASCLLNPMHRRSICRYCRAKFDVGYKRVGLDSNCVRVLPAAEDGPHAEVPAVFETIDDLQAYSHDGADLGMAVASTLIWRFDKNHRFDTVAAADAVRTELEMSIHVYESMLRVLPPLEVDRVYVFNGRHSTTRPVIRACEKLGVTYYTHERGGDFSRYILRENTIPHDLDAVAAEIPNVWEHGGKDRGQIGEQFFLRRRRRIERSWFSFTKRQEVGLLPDGFSPTTRNIAIFNSTLQEAVGMPWFKNRIYRDELDGVDRILGQFKDEPHYRFYLRVHPNLAEEFRRIDEQNNTQLRALGDLRTRCPYLVVIPPLSPVDSYALMEACDVTVVFGSTMGAEATYWGRPSILAGAGAAYQSLDCCYKPSTHDELTSLLRADLRPKSKAEAVKYGFYELRRGVEYRRFVHDGVLKGRYEGKRIVPPLGARLGAYAMRLLDATNKREIAALLSDLKKLRSRT